MIEVDITTEPAEYADDDDKGASKGKGKDEKGKKGTKDKDDEALMNGEDSEVRGSCVVARVS